jgi:hypothetical protein
VCTERKYFFLISSAINIDKLIFLYLFPFVLFFSVPLLKSYITRGSLFLAYTLYMCNVLRRKMQTQQYSNKPGTFAILYSFSAVLMQINYFLLASWICKMLLPLQLNKFKEYCSQIL